MDVLQPNLTFLPILPAQLATPSGTLPPEPVLPVKVTAHGMQLLKNVNVMLLTMLMQKESVYIVQDLVKVGMPRTNPALYVSAHRSTIRLVQNVNAHHLIHILTMQANAFHAIRQHLIRPQRLALSVLNHGLTTKLVENVSVQHHILISTMLACVYHVIQQPLTRLQRHASYVLNHGFSIKQALNVSAHHLILISTMPVNVCHAHQLHSTRQPKLVLSANLELSGTLPTIIVQKDVLIRL